MRNPATDFGDFGMSCQTSICDEAFAGSGKRKDTGLNRIRSDAAGFLQPCMTLFSLCFNCLFFNPQPLKDGMPFCIYFHGFLDGLLGLCQPLPQSFSLLPSDGNGLPDILR